MNTEMINEIITALEDNFHEHGRCRGRDYTYGYMDALAVLREMRDDIQPEVRRKCGMVST